MIGRKKLRGVWDIVKKGLDPVDDITMAVRKLLEQGKQAFSPASQLALELAISIVIGVVGILSHAIEFFSSLFSLYKYFNKKKKLDQQRVNQQISEKDWQKNHLVLNLKSFFASYNATLAAGGLGVSIAYIIATVTVLPVAALFVSLAPILIPGIMLVIFANNLIRNALLLNHELQELKDSKIEIGANQVPDNIHRLQTKVALNSIECISAAMVLTGLITGLLPLILIGVGIAIGAKVFEYQDKKKDGKYSKAIRHLFTGQKVIHIVKDKELINVSQMTPTPQPPTPILNGSTEPRPQNNLQQNNLQIVPFSPAQPAYSQHGMFPRPSLPSAIHTPKNDAVSLIPPKPGGSVLSSSPAHK